MAPPPRRAPPTDSKTPQAASGRHVGVGSTTLRRCRAPAPRQRLRAAADRARREAAGAHRAGRRCRSIGRRSSAGSGSSPATASACRTGALVGVDIDILDPDLAHQVDQHGAVAARRHADAGRAVAEAAAALSNRPRPSRRWPPAASRSSALGQQFVAFGMHPTTGEPYDWPLGETPLEVPFDALPLVDAGGCAALLGEIAGLLPARPRDASGAHADTSTERRPTDAATSASQPVRSGTPAAASSTAATAGSRPSPTTRSTTPSPPATAWARRARRGRSGSGSPPPPTSTARPPTAPPTRSADAERKVADKLRLLAEGRLPPRDAAGASRPTTRRRALGSRSPGAARGAARAACDRIEAWHAAPESRRPADRHQGHGRPRQERQRPPAAARAARSACSPPARRRACWC